jgi:hypothetical protein
MIAFAAGAKNDVHVAAMSTMVPGSMGMNTPFNFQLDGKNAAVRHLVRQA